MQQQVVLSKKARILSGMAAIFFLGAALIDIYMPESQFISALFVFIGLIIGWMFLIERKKNIQE